MIEQTWRDLIKVLRFVANSEDQADADDALNLFAEIIALRPWDTSQVIAILKPVKPPKNVDDSDQSSSEGDSGIDVENLGANKATDIFILKFLLSTGK